MQIRNSNPTGDSLELTDLGVTVPHGRTVDVPAKLGHELVATENWTEVRTKKEA